MAYKTILLHLDDARNMDARMQLAFNISLAEKAHLVAIAPTGVTRYFLENPSTAESTVPLASERDESQRRADAVADKFENRASQESGLSYEAHIVEDDAYGSLETRLPYSDLVILGQYDVASSFNAQDASLARDILLGGGGPVLIVPRETQAAQIPGRALIAWNGSVQARRAVHDALPLLQHCKTVQIAIFSPTGQAEKPGSQLQHFLARHGISSKLIVRTGTYQEVQQMLLPTIADTGSDLLVMGSYGHSSFHERLLGGVTRTVLQQTPVPVLMSH